MGKYSDTLLLPPKKQEEQRQRVKYSDSLLLGDLGPQDQFIGDKPLSSVMTKQFMKDQKDPAGMGTMLQAGIVDDPQTKIKIYAKTRFPNDPNAEKRYGFHKGEIVYMGDDGNLYRETPDTWLAKAKRFTAETGAHLPTLILSSIGAVGGPGTAALGAAGGEGIRKSIGSTVYGEPQTATGNIKSMATEGALAFGGEKVGRLIGRGVNRIGAARGGKLSTHAGRHRGLINPKEVARMERLGKDFGIDLYAPQTTGSKRLADKFSLLGDLEPSSGIIQKARTKQVEQIDDAVYKFLKEVSPGKETVSETGGKLVKASKKALMEPVSVRRARAGPIYKKAFEKRSVVDTDRLLASLKLTKNRIKNLENVKPTAVLDDMIKELKGRGVPTMRVTKETDQAYLSRISSDYKRILKKDVPVAGGTKDIKEINKLKKHKNAIEQALEGKPPDGFKVPKKPRVINVSDATQEIDGLLGKTVKGDPSFAVLTKIKNMIQESKGDLLKLHRVKTRGIDAVLNKAKSDRVLRREMKIVKDKLVKAMDEISPDYAKARKIYGDLSEEITKQGKKTILGDVAKLEGDKVVSATRKLLASPEVKRAPEIVRKVRNAITKQDPEVWDRAMAVHLQELFESTKMSATGGITNIGGHFYKKAWGDLAQRKVLKQAMSPNQFNNLKRFMQVLERTGMILGKESATASRQVMLEEMQGKTLGRVVRAATRPLYTKERLLGDRLLESVLSKNAKNLAEAMTSEKASQQLQRMLQLSKRGQNVLAQFTTFLTLVSSGEFRRGRQRSKTQDVLPARLKGQKSTQQGRIKMPQ